MFIKTTRIAALTTLCAASLSIAAMPAHAAAPTETSTNSSVENGSPAASTPLTPTSLGKANTANDEAVLKRLHALVGTQSAEELAQIQHSGKPAQLLLDENNKPIAGYVEQPKITPYLSVRGPGCALGDACATSSAGTANGFYGTGSLNWKLSGIVKIFAGQYTTTFWNGSSGVYVAPNQTSYLASPRAFDKVTRS